MPAKSKADLLAVTQAQYSKLKALIDLVGPHQAMIPDEDGITLKDIVAHRAHWIDLFLGWYHDGQKGRTPYFPAKGFKWNDLKRYNADLRAAQKHLDWDAACAMLAKNAEALLGLIESLDDAALYSGQMKGASSKWTVGRWAEAAGGSHYRSAAKYIRARRKEFAKKA